MIASASAAAPRLRPLQVLSCGWGGGGPSILDGPIALQSLDVMHLLLDTHMLVTSQVTCPCMVATRPPRYGPADFGFRTVTSLLPAANFRLGLHACGQTAVNVRDVTEFECSCTTQATHSCGGNIIVELPPLPWEVCVGTLPSNIEHRSTFLVAFVVMLTKPTKYRLLLCRQLCRSVLVM